MDNENFNISYKDKLANVTKDVKALLNKFNEAQDKNNEKEFFKNNKNKDLVLTLENGTQFKGKLLEIDKFRIKLETDGKIWHIFKHSIVSYYAL